MEGTSNLGKQVLNWWTINDHITLPYLPIVPLPTAQVPYICNQLGFPPRACHRDTRPFFCSYLGAFLIISIVFNMTPKIKIRVKYNQPNDRSAKLLLNMYSQLRVRIVDIDIVKDAFILIFDNIREAEKIFDENNKTAVSLDNFEPIMPREIVCERTLFIKLNHLLLSYTVEEMKDELKNHNADISIIDATKITNSNYLKLTVDSSATADRLLKDGIKMFNLHIPGSNINKQHFIEVIKCYNCFGYNDHQTRYCPKPKSIKCTNCSGNHLYQSCTKNRDEISCFHCNENHHTFSYSCKVKKQIIKEIKYQSSLPKTYASTARNTGLFEIRPSAMNNRPPLLPPPQPARTLLPTPLMNMPPPAAPFPLHPATADLMITVMAKMNAAIQIALHQDSVEPNSFTKTYQELCQENDLPILKLGNFKPSSIAPPMNREVPGNHQIVNELDNTSFISATEENHSNSTVTGTDQISSSPKTLSRNPENSSLNTTRTTPIKKVKHPNLREGNSISPLAASLINDSITPAGSTQNSLIPKDGTQENPSMSPSPTPPSQPHNSPPLPSPSTRAPTSHTPSQPSARSPTRSCSPLSPHVIPPLLNAAPTTPSPPQISPPPPENEPSPEGHISPLNVTPPSPITAPSSALIKNCPFVPNSLQHQAPTISIARNSISNPSQLKLKLYRKSRAPYKNIVQLKKSLNEGRLSIELNDKIVKDKSQLDFVINNHFDALLQADTRVTDIEMKKILGS